MGMPGMLWIVPVSDEPYETPLPVPLTVRSLKVTVDHGEVGRTGSANVLADLGTRGAGQEQKQKED